MLTSPADEVRSRNVEQIRRHATDLFNQQCWCWGRDVLRPEGNWLQELGFEKLKPPADRKDCSSSVYQLSLSGGRCVVLRGFGAYFGDRKLGGVFLSRNKFEPRYLSQSKLEHPPWSDSDLPESQPITETNRESYTMLTRCLIDWIADYEMEVLSRLGLPYREMTLIPWDTRKRNVIPAEHFASSWRELSSQIAENEEILN
ncbi:hypothetical protein DTL42_18535 [Bremerella cremea]|uniref:Uncharacterized protein n=1 Tax=Bremerella cremea TaxID=1031537 RepID=A0A368KRC7_9BACT|nr:hypothetical protein [Bremerella cremea]RCS43981.1 hypothetical protein DTL42_18535 [Bremerella cremea]